MRGAANLEDTTEKHPVPDSADFGQTGMSVLLYTRRNSPSPAQPVSSKNQAQKIIDFQTSSALSSRSQRDIVFASTLTADSPRLPHSN